SWMQAATLEWVPGKPFSLDNFRSLSVDSVGGEDGLGVLGIAATPLEAVAPGYIGGKDSRGQYDSFRRVRP
ncbi:MAG TPA: complex I NDUFA9 subunit family protein, partial [Gammaproteobacteria bacterium]|nr:complex I NDUFA9 subunit family protein [Gammaproteobacteria bacterium]